MNRKWPLYWGGLFTLTGIAILLSVPFCWRLCGGMFWIIVCDLVLDD